MKTTCGLARISFSAVKVCHFGDPTASVDVALVGNSHATQWLPALQRIAMAEHFRVTTYLSEKCFATDTAIRPSGLAARARRKCSAPCFCVCQCIPVVRSS